MPKDNYINGNISKKHLLKTFFASTLFLTNGLWIIGFIIVFGGFSLGSYIYSERIPDLYLGIVMSIGLPWPMLSCLFIILRREISRFGLPSIKGRSAVFQGYLGLVIISITEVYVISLILK